MHPEKLNWYNYLETDVKLFNGTFAKGGPVDPGHNCGCGYPNAAPPCWHCTSCPECNCEVCDDFHNTAVGEICPELQFVNPILYQKKVGGSEGQGDGTTEDQEVR